jgi:hypothetical protein
MDHVQVARTVGMNIMTIKIIVFIVVLRVMEVAQVAPRASINMVLATISVDTVVLRVQDHVLAVHMENTKNNRCFREQIMLNGLPIEHYFKVGL